MVLKKQQYLLVGSALTLLVLLFFFGRTVSNQPVAKAGSEVAGTHTDHDDHDEHTVDFNQMLTHAKERLTPQQAQKVAKLENLVTRGDVKRQQLQSYRQLAAFWGDSIHLFEPYAFYTAEAAKLENSEKSLTFAAHLFLNNLKTEGDHAMQHWLALNAKDLFDKALEVNPTNDSSKVGLGACYILGNISDNPMQGITLVREVLNKDPNNQFAQLILGLGGVRSGQFDKAIERFTAIVNQDPNNLEALLNLAEAYDRKGDKANAVKWYKVVKSNINNPEAQKELDARIKANQ